MEEAAENLGEILSGDKIETSAYSVNMRVDAYCKIVCKRTYNKEELQLFSSAVDDEYRVNWLLDALPAATKYYTVSTPGDTNGKEGYVEHYEKGFPLGFVGSTEIEKSQVGTKYIHNHLILKVFYHEEPQKMNSVATRVVGFEVDVASVKHKVDGKWDDTPDKLQENAARITTCYHAGKGEPVKNADGSESPPQPEKPQPSDYQKVNSVENGDDTIIFTYDVIWHLRKDVRWASRWDLYLKMTDSKVHWFSIVNSFMIVLFLTGQSRLHSN